MRFIDASVFLYAYLKPKKRIPVDIEVLKKNARNIVRRIENREEQVTTTLIHISEIANILGSRSSVITTADIISSLLDLSNLDIVEPSKAMYETSIESSRSYNVGINDALAHIVMERENISEVYSFDGDFDKFKDVKRVTA
jgi:predicted nucleic acid-binding protein